MYVEFNEGGICRGVEVVLDGEVVARNKATQSFLAFGTNR